MKRNLLSAIIFTFLSATTFAATGGPDTYGYIWTDSNEPGGPVYNWIDISGTGNLVSGLTDDNSVAFIPMGMSFHYYWGDFNQVKVGSNGWIGFNNTGNIAHCFPTIPVPGGAGDNYMAPFMTDLNFSGIGNPAKVYYEHDALNNRFIISYIDVPWWTAVAPDYIGMNSFQVILDGADSSITYQYKDSDLANFTDQLGCVTDIVIGMEGPTGNIGLSIYQDIMPPASYAIKFTYPNPVLIQIPDITPLWTSNIENSAEFHYSGENIQIPVNIKSVGNQDVTSDIIVDLQILNDIPATVASFQFTIVGGLIAGADSIVDFQWMPASNGQFSVEANITNVDDINFSNNLMITELEILDPATPSARMSYVNETDFNTGSISWGSGAGDGVGVYMTPASYPFQLDSIGAFLLTAGDDVTFEVYADDGPSNTPGTLLHAITLPTASVTYNTWVRSEIPVPIIITSGGFYIAWIQQGTITTIGTVTYTPLSRNNLEYLGGWAEYRYNQTEDLMIEAFGYSVCGTLNASATTSDEMLGADGSIDLTVNGGVSPYSFSWTGGAGSVEDPTNLTAGIYTVTITDDVGCETILEVTVGSQVGLAENSIQSSEWSIYPNPSTGLFTVSMNENTSSIERINVLDVTGRIIHTTGAGNNQEIQIDKAGLYYVIVETTIGSDVKRVVVE